MKKDLARYILNTLIAAGMEPVRLDAYPQKGVQRTWRRLVRAGLVAGVRRYGCYRGVLTWAGHEYHANEGRDF